jgi:hypothetical protein
LITLIVLVVGGAMPATDPNFKPTPDPNPPTEHCGVDGNCVPQ